MLKTQAEAVKNALVEYNRRAAALHPPRPQFTLDQVMEAVLLADLDLLRYTRTDICNEDWSKHTNCQAVNLHQKITHMRGKIQQLNQEGPHLLTFLIDRHYDVNEAIAELKPTNPHLSYKIQLCQEYDENVSVQLAECLYQMSQLKGSTMKLVAGKRVGRSQRPLPDVPLPAWACYHSDESRESDIAQRSHDLSNATTGRSATTEEVSAADALSGSVGDDAMPIDADGNDTTPQHDVRPDAEDDHDDDGSDDDEAEAPIFPDVDNEHADDYVSFLDDLSIV